MGVLDHALGNEREQARKLHVRDDDHHAEQQDDRVPVDRAISSIQRERVDADHEAGPDDRRSGPVYPEPREPPDREHGVGQQEYDLGSHSLLLKYSIAIGACGGWKPPRKLETCPTPNETPAKQLPVASVFATNKDDRFFVYSTAMLTRRSLLGAAGAFSAASLLRAQGRNAAAGAPPMAFPPDSPIGRLKSRRSEAVPITNEERQARMDKAQRLMRENKIESIAMIGGSSLEYFANVRWGNSERLFIMILPARGEPFFVAPAFEKDRALEQIARGPAGKSPHVFTWEEDESPYQTVAFGLKERGLATGRLGLEERVQFVFAEGIGKAAPSATVTLATPVTAGCRMIKSPAELALMRLASSVTLAAYEAAWASLKSGMTQNQFGAMVAAAHEKQGFRGYASVQVGEYSALPHGSVTPQVIREGTILLIDGGCTVEGYESDISRTFVLGKAADKMNQVFDIVHRAQSAALAAAKPGVPADSVDAAARKVIVDAGYGPGFKYFTHRLGHGIGLDGHEWPYLTRTNTLLVDGKSIPLAAHMVFSDEPGIYIRGEFGVRLEDDMHITEDGSELFTPQSPSLEQPFGHAL